MEILVLQAFFESSAAHEVSEQERVDAGLLSRDSSRNHVILRYTFLELLYLEKETHIRIFLPAALERTLFCQN